MQRNRFSYSAGFALQSAEIAWQEKRYDLFVTNQENPNMLQADSARKLLVIISYLFG